ncbi:hypothetical protein AVEN_207796-1 [Araneus ventricosus]|uniref:Uncharacterized protein n=1 Tax=Araneus ventricosus TaxID=182803 RepID=A0A4Y2BWS3_ARAVE|nr:hypothetical protein AVEN_207796-1 [Araneus ventricosus]
MMSAFVQTDVIQKLTLETLEQLQFKIVNKSCDLIGNMMNTVQQRIPRLPLLDDFTPVFILACSAFSKWVAKRQTFQFAGRVVDSWTEKPVLLY